MRGKNKVKQIKRYYSFSDYLLKTFNKKVYKLSLDAGFTCPNRDGTVGCGGCIFCSEGGSGDFAQKIINGNVDEAIEKAKERVKNKTETNAYIAYFQSFTNTYAPIQTLKDLFTKAINREDIVALSIATRPDCLGEEVINLIKELCAIKPVFVELGLQTIHKKTAEFIRRGYQLEAFDKSVVNLQNAGAKVVVHLILGLPNESEEMILQSVKYVASKKVDGVKLQLLHVLENTDLATVYKNKPFKIFTQEEYISLLAKCVEILPKETVIHRLTGDAPKKLLIAPVWSANKKGVLNELTAYFNKRDILQGKNYSP